MKTKNSVQLSLTDAHEEFKYKKDMGGGFSNEACLGGCELASAYLDEIEQKSFMEFDLNFD